MILCLFLRGVPKIQSIHNSKFFPNSASENIFWWLLCSIKSRCHLLCFGLFFGPYFFQRSSCAVAHTWGIRLFRKIFFKGCCTDSKAVDSFSAKAFFWTIHFCLTTVLGLGVDFSFALDNNNNDNNDNNGSNDNNNPCLNFIFWNQEVEESYTKKNL